MIQRVAPLLVASAWLASCGKPQTCVVGAQRACSCKDGGPGVQTCYGEEPADWGYCACDRAPIANAGASEDVPVRTAIVLDGTASSDPTGLQLSYTWTVESQPPGSSAVLDDPTAMQPMLVPDVVGRYVLGLTVSDSVASSEPAWVVLHAVNTAPIAMVSSTSNASTGSTIVLDGSASSDPNGDPLTYSWTVTSRPSGSVAMPSTPTQSTTSFTPDVDGQYIFALVVDDGQLASQPAIATVNSFHGISTLTFRPIDAEYSAALDRIVMVATSPDSLYLFDPVSAVTVSVPLAAPPLAVSVAPDGLHAVVAHGGSLSWVDLQAAKVLATYTVSATDASDIVYAGNGYACVFPGSATSSPAIRNIHLSDGAETTSSSVSEYANAKARLMPGATSTTIVADEPAPDEFDRFDVSTGTATWNGRGFGPLCGNLWISDDALVIYTACGSFVRPSDFNFRGELYMSTGGQTQLVNVATATSRNRVFAIWKSRSTMFQDDEIVNIYTYQTPDLPIQTTQLPPFIVGNSAFPAHGHFVFVRGDATQYYVIVQADASAGLTNDYGVTSYGF